jgi:hypothetical protein
MAMTPVSTTALNLTRDWIPSLISRTASSGSAETAAGETATLDITATVDGPFQQRFGTRVVA